MGYLSLRHRTSKAVMDSDKSVVSMSLDQTAIGGRVVWSSMVILTTDYDSCDDELLV